MAQTIPKLAPLLGYSEDVLNIWSELNYILSHKLVHTTTCFGPVYLPSSGCIINLISSYTICAWGTLGGPDLVPPQYLTHILQLLIKFIIQPDDGQYTGPKHVVLCTNLCENIQLCSDHIFNTFFIIYSNLIFYMLNMLII